MTARKVAMLAIAEHLLLELMSETGIVGTAGRTLDVIRLRKNAPSADGAGCARLNSLICDFGAKQYLR